MQEFNGATVSGFLRKPYTVNTLTRMVRSILGKRTRWLEGSLAPLPSIFYCQASAQAYFSAKHLPAYFSVKHLPAYFSAKHLPAYFYAKHT